MEKLSVIGCGAFGYALALLFARTHPELEVHVYDVVEEYVTGLQRTGHHPFFHSDVEAPRNLVPSLDQEAVLADAGLVLVAVPAQALRKAVEAARGRIPERAIVLNVAKALEAGSDKRMSVVIREALGRGSNPIATLSGGMIAADVAHGSPVGAVVGCEDESALRTIEALLKPSSVHVETTTDIAGVEYSGAFKNFIAIGAGIADGLGYGASSKAFFITKAVQETEELAVKLDARYETFHTASDAWIGDLMTTCFGDTRNSLFGRLIGEGLPAEEAVAKLKEERKHAEGLATLRAVKDLLAKHEVKAPFLTALYEIVFEGAAARERFQGFALLQNC